MQELCTVYVCVCVCVIMYNSAKRVSARHYETTDAAFHYQFSTLYVINVYFYHVHGLTQWTQ